LTTLFDASGEKCDPLNARLIDVSLGGALITLDRPSETKTLTTTVEFAIGDDGKCTGGGTWLRHYRQDVDESFALAWDEMSSQLQSWVESNAGPGSNEVSKPPADSQA
jgi:hypothetical protein